MGKHMLFALLSGLLILGLSTAFAEEPQPSDQEILKAWSQVQTDVEQIAKVATLERKGFKPMTDENLDEITAAGFALITNQNNVFGLVVNTGSCQVLIGVCNPRMKLPEP